MQKWERSLFTEYENKNIRKTPGTNENGKRMDDICVERETVTSNTNFRKMIIIHKYTWDETPKEFTD